MNDIQVSPTQDHLLSNKQYDVMRRVVQVVLPAVAAFYAGLAALLGLPFGLEVVGVIALVATLLGTVLGISEKSYNNSDAKYDGDMVVTRFGDDMENVPAVQIAWNDVPEVTAQKDQVILRVLRP